MKKVLKILLLIVLLPLLYIVGVILYGTLTDYKPDEKTAVKETKVVNKVIEKDTLVAYIWNIGYAGLGEESDFFMDGGVTTRVSKELTEKNLNGIVNKINSWKDADFILIQEIDEVAKRSYGVNQFTTIENTLADNWSAALGYNYRAKYIPVPLLKPYGKVIAGLGSFTPYKSTATTRYQFPGNFGWPKSIFFLDRCFLVQRFPFKGKELLMINTHNSAYDDGSLKAGQMKYLKDFVTAEYNAGNYVIVGGDWNQCPPNFDCYGGFTEAEIEYRQSSIEDNYMPSDWNWAFDGSVKTNRKLKTEYIPDKTFTTVIDFFLTSPNVEVIETEGQDLKFQYSDHQPVRMSFKLK